MTIRKLLIHPPPPRKNTTTISIHHHHTRLVHQPKRLTYTAVIFDLSRRFLASRLLSNTSPTKIIPAHPTHQNTICSPVLMSGSEHEKSGLNRLRRASEHQNQNISTVIKLWPALRWFYKTMSW